MGAAVVSCCAIPALQSRLHRVRVVVDDCEVLRQSERERDLMGFESAGLAVNGLEVRGEKCETKTLARIRSATPGSLQP